MKRALAQYEGCSPDAIASGSKAQMMYFVEDAKADIAQLHAALTKAQKALAMIVSPNAIARSSIIDAFANLKSSAPLSPPPARLMALAR